MRRTILPAVLVGALAALLVAAATAPAQVVRTPGYSGITRAIATQSPATPPASALGTGTRPDILVDAAGTAHVVWTNAQSGQPSQTVYCRVPRGARSCETTHALVPPGADQYSVDLSGPAVAAVNDQVVVMSHRYPQQVDRPDGTRSSSVVYMWTSDDGGATFSTPAMVAGGGADNIVGIGNVAGGAVAFGPAENPSIAFTNDISTGGTAVTTVRAGAYTPQGAPIAAGDFIHANLAVHQGLPVVAYAATSGEALMRRWSGQGDPNDGGTWTAQEGLGGFVPRVTDAGGKLLVATASSLIGGEITLRDLTNGRSLVLNPGARGSEHRVAGLPDGRAVVTWGGTERANSRTHATWMRMIGANGRPQAAPVAIGPFTYFSGMAVAADGGGFVVGQQEAGGNTILLSAFGPRTPTGRVGLGSRPGGGALPPDTVVDCQRIRFGAVETLLQDGCFLNAARGVAKASVGPVRLNGLEIVPDAGVQIIINARQRTIDTTGTVRVLLRAPDVPEILLYRGRLNLRLQSAAAGVSLFGFTRGLFPTNVLGFPVAGEVDVRLTDRGVRIPISLRLPAGFGGVTGSTVLLADSRRGLVLESLEFRADGVPLGVATMRRLHVQYKAQGGTSIGDCLRPPTSGASASPNEWAGVFELELPPPATGPKLCGSVRFGNGAFRAATFNINLPPPGIVLFPSVSLTALGGGLALQPTKIDAAVRIGVISAGGGASVVNLDGRLSATFGSPFTLRGDVAATTAGVGIGNGTFILSTDGYVGLRLNAGPKVGPLDLKARINGFVDGPRGQFSLSGRGEVCIEGACVSGGGGVVSTRGIAACLPAPAVPRGAGYHWGRPIFGGVEIWLLSCNMDDYEVADTRQNGFRAHQVAGTEAVTQVRGRPATANIRVRGQGGVPDVDLIGPDGAPVTPEASYPVPSDESLFLGLRAPAAGTWTVRARPGSVPVVEVATSHEVAPATVSGVRVLGRGRARVLQYRARIAAGQSVTFAERGRAGTRIVGEARAGARRLAFTPGPGAGGRREIVALVAQDGLVRADQVVARYVAPNPPPVGRATQLRVRRAGTRALATWRPGAGLAAQRVQARVSDGRVISRTMPARARQLVVPGLTRGDRVTVRVVGQARDGRQGRAAQAALRIR